MKTLDEVIFEASYSSTQWEADALHYLKELRRILDNTIWVESTKEENGYWKLPTLLETRNDPITCDEFRTMEGRPMWIDAKSLPVGASPYWKDWYIIKSFSNDEFMYCNDDFEWTKGMQE